MEGLAKAAGHADRAGPLKPYCTGLLLPGERKSVKPMAARLALDNAGRMHQSLHHLVADAPWSDEAVLEQVRGYALSAMKAKGCVKKTRRRHAVREMRVGPSESPCRGRLQTAMGCFGQKPRW